MKIKTKIRLGLIFLLAIIITLAVTGSYYINKLADISSTTLRNNYETLEYTKNMIQAMDSADEVTALSFFEQNMVKQENNITEPGEAQATQKARRLFEDYKMGKRDETTNKELRKTILLIQELNMKAIVRKSDEAGRATKKVFAYITILGTACFLLSFTFVLNFPGLIANPIAVLTSSIREIANKNYKERVNFTSHDEFGELATAFNTMAQRLDEYESSNLNKLMFEKKRIETIINNMRDAIIGFDETKRVLFANTVAIQLLGIYEKDIIGKYAPDVALHNDLLRNLLQRDTKDKPLKIFADGKESYFTKDMLEISNAQQKIGEVIILRNVTKFQELDVAKTNFIATISHEFKTPISSIKMSLKLLEDERIGSLNEEQKKLLGNIKGDSQRLLKITGELLDMAQVESGNIHLEVVAANPGQIINQAVDAVLSLAAQKNITIEKQVKEGLPAITADMDKTSWVLLNFLSNAIKHSSENSKVIIKAEPKSGSVLFSVQDFGKGINKEYHAQIFEKFFQVPGSVSGGSGMGLAISREIIERQNGTIGVESEPGKGSTFWFELKS